MSLEGSPSIAPGTAGARPHAPESARRTPARRRLGVRGRVALVSAAALVAAIAASSSVVYLVVRHDLIARVDGTLRHRARVLERRRAAQGLGALTLEASRPSRAPSSPTVLAQVFTAHGTVIGTGRAGTHLPLTLEARRVAAGAAPRYFSSGNLGIGPVRVLVVPLGSGLGLEVVAPDAALVAELSHLTVVLAVTAAAGAVLALGLGAAVAGVALRPVRQLTLSAERLAVTRDLAAEIPVGGNDELGRLGRSINSLLVALHRSQQAQRQLVADASHELRTPITSLRTNVEVLVRARNLDEGERGQLVEDISSELGSLSRLIDDVIDLARDESRTRAPASLRPVALDELVDEVVEREARLHRQVRFSCDLAPVRVVGVAEDLERAVANLLDNAAKWSPDGCTVEVRLRRDENWEPPEPLHRRFASRALRVIEGSPGRARAILTVQDEGPGIAEGDLPHVFESFYRGAGARSVPGSGLGLAIVQRVAEAHLGEVALASIAGGGTLATLWLPVLDAGGAPSQDRATPQGGSRVAD